MAVLLDELKHEDVSRRLESMRQLKVIADALGPDRTRNELVPFLADSLDDDDEVLLVMATELGASFVPLVGGPQHAVALLAPLESLATMEEATVRDKAVESMVSISALLTDAQVQDAVVSAVRSLAQRDWFTARISACGLFSTTYGRVNAATKTELRGLFASLCKDDTPMVRRSAAQALGAFAAVVEPDAATAELVPLFLGLCQDEQDSVRLLAVHGAVALAKLVPADVAKDKLMPKLLALASDKSWRVRWSVAQAFKAVVSGPELSKLNASQLLDAFITLLKDAEAEVRAAASCNVTAVAKAFPVDTVVAQLVGPVTAVSRDPSEYVREALASNVMGLAPVVGKDKAVEQLLPVFLQLLKDENAMVRLAVVSDLASAEGVIGVDLLSSALLPAIVDLSEERNWRTRAKIIEHIASLAKQLDVNYFDQNLAELCLSWLTYKVFAIREAAAQNLVKLVGVYGQAWARSKIVPRVVDLKSHHHYLYRLTCVLTIEALIPVLHESDAANVLVPVILSLATDPVPNVRFGVAKALERLAVACPWALEKMDAVKPTLRTMSSDPDNDVKYFARRAAKKVDGVGAS